MKNACLMFSIFELVAITGASAQGVITAKLEGQPLVYMKDGKIDGCGVRIVIVDTPPRLESRSVITTYDISFNLFSRGHSVIKGGSGDGTYADHTANNRAKVKPVALKHLWLKARGENATTALQGTMKGDDPGTILYAADSGIVASLFLAQSKNEAILVGIRRQGASADRIFSGTIEMTVEERQQVSACLMEALPK